MVVDLYEPQTLALIVFGGFVALSFVVYLFSAFGIQEKSYEQAVAEQRARLEKEQVQQREGKRQKRKQFFEKKKREREKHDSSPGILRQEVAQAIDPYVEEVEQAPPSPPPVKEEKVNAYINVKQVWLVTSWKITNISITDLIETLACSKWKLSKVILNAIG